MQNHNSVNTSKFVSLEQGRTGWRCRRCGCQNSCGCQNGCGGQCRQCGCACPWSGGCVRGNASAAADASASGANVTCPCKAQCRETADRTCDACSACTASAGNGGDCRSCPVEAAQRYVQSCPDNTTLRSANGSGSCTGNQTRTASTCTACEAQQTSTGCPCSTGASCQVCQSCPCDSGCGTAAAATAAEKARNRAAGMVYAAKQKLDQAFDSESALRTGTLFPELHKPMNGYCPGDCNCATPCQESAFAAWDLRLYLDTHPDDERAQALFRQLSGEACEPNYATAFLPDDDLPDGWDWTQDPWPWSCRDCGR